MKKIFLSLIVLLLFESPVMAASILSDYSVKLIQYETKALPSIIITSTTVKDITSEHGIHILLTKSDRILFDKQDLIFTGTAVDNNKLSSDTQAVFSEDYKSLFIPVLQDFEVGDWLKIQGLALRSYDDVFSSRYLGFDLDGDYIAEVSDINFYKVINEERNDITNPYPVTNVNYLINENGNVVFNWVRPPDYDYTKTIINRTRIKNGYSMESTVYNDTNESFIDSDLEDISSASYSFIASDSGFNWSEPVVVTIDFSEESTSSPEEEVEESSSNPEEEVEEDSEETSADEIADLERLLNYYNVRYSIKCHPSGVAVAKSNSACLWARIDLLYAQDVTGDIKVHDMSLSDYDINLMTKRRQWPEKRYQDNCVASQNPASYCPALQKALNRMSFFLD